MPEVTILVAGQDIQELKEAIDNNLRSSIVQTDLSSPYRDQTILQIVLSAATGALVKAVFDLVKGYVESRMAKSTAEPEKGEIAVKVGDTTITIRSTADTGELSRVLRAALEASEQKT